MAAFNGCDCGDDHNKKGHDELSFISGLKLFIFSRLFMAINETKC